MLAGISRLPLYRVHSLIEFILQRLPIRSRDPWSRAYVGAPVLALLCVLAVLTGSSIQAAVFVCVDWAEAYGGMLGFIVSLVGIVPLALAWFLLIIMPCWWLATLPHQLTYDLAVPGVRSGRIWRLRAWGLLWGITGIGALGLSMRTFSLGESPW